MLDAALHLCGTAVQRDLADPTVFERIIDAPEQKAQRGRPAQRRQPRMVDGESRRNELFRPRHRLVTLHETTQEPADTGNASSGVEIAHVSGPPKSSAQVG